MSNPLLKDSVFQSPVNSNEVMTMSGVINKSIILWVLLATSAFYSWTHPNVITPLVMPILLGGFVLAMISIFKQAASPFLSPIYAICEGLALGAISLYFEKAHTGIVVNAILLTVCVLFCMLAAYKTGILKATPRFQRVVIFSTLAIALVYIVNLLLNLFGAGSFPYLHNSSGLGIVINLAIVIVASLKLIIDFDLIEQGVQYGAPKYMEWYSAFSLMITLVWLYIEVLRLLSKLRD
ncbi:MAG: Bax inhibitor-1/YccA family protein [Endomicrobium sp.]|uniref:Bax inhibitor-1/YccA family protein n=1 Tax=Candidatus Endomicrobiellum pyrsonymphae TaxID=1408203 RepID=UPI00358B694A|nr:Bax inhibitor-1/YccA family protein [Endomicrobium sp.]